MRGDSQAFGTLVQRLRAPLCGYLGGLLRRHGDDVEEIAQESFLVAWQKLATLREPASFSAWLFRIARNLASKRAQLPHGLPLTEDPAMEETAEVNEQRITALMAAVSQLAQPQREVVLRKHFQGATAEQIADELGIAVGTVWSRLSRAYAELREKLAAVETP